jgi:Domain of unknown function (DUF1905)
LTQQRARGCVAPVEPVSFRATVRFWDPAKQGGLAVVDVPQQQIVELGGLRQQRVHGELNGTAFTSSVMPAGGGRLAMSVSKAMLKASALGVGDAAEVKIVRTGA